MLKFANGNKKINEVAKMLNLKKNEVFSFDLPAGWTCPCADICLSKADKKTGKIIDGKNLKFRCYAASNEAYAVAARALRWNNFDLLKNSDNMVELINASLPKTAKIVRLHASGDFFNANYFNAWVEVAKNNPQIMFYGYTKVINYVTAEKPVNFKLVYSHGGKMDYMLTDNIPTAFVLTEKTDNLPIACEKMPSDDYYYIINQKSFGLMLHGTQPARV